MNAASLIQDPTASGRRRGRGQRSDCLAQAILHSEIPSALPAASSQQMLLRLTEDRALENRGERKVVFGLKQETAEGGRSLNGDMARTGSAGRRRRPRFARRFKARDSALTKRSRFRTSTRMSPAPMRSLPFPRSFRRGESSPPIGCGNVLAQRVRTAPSAWSMAARQSSGSATVSAPTSARSRHSRERRHGWPGGQGSPGRALRPSRISGDAKMRSTAASTSSVDRNDHVRPHLFEQPARRAERCRRIRSRSQRKKRGRRPGRNRSTAFRRRRQIACAQRPSRALAPEKNSAARCLTTCHCSGLVSCASSTRIWSMP